MDVLQFSGGKDSLACLHLLREKWDGIVVMWVNSGAPWPQTEEQMRKIEKMVPHFLEIKADVLAQNDVHGIPADIVPIVNSLPGQSLHGRRPELLQSWMQCCSHSLWQPAHAAIKAIEPKIIYRGQRNQEQYKSLVRSGMVVQGIEYIFPIENWSEDDVAKFLVENNIEIPEYYEWSAKSLDCWHCTAYLEDRMGQVRWLKENDPDKYRFVEGRLKKIQRATEEQLGYVRDALK